MNAVDYYEFLQISPHADQETIHRIYRFLGARFHPDNPDSGDADTFAILKSAYETLSDPTRRAEYDATCSREPLERPPLSNSVDFMDTLDGETNRRLAFLAVLYFQRRNNPGQPHVSLTEIERRMGFPRDYLDFTSWYLQQKKFIIIADNSDFTLTVQGVDFVETQRAHIPVLNRLLTDGSASNGNGNGNGANGHAPATNGHAQVTNGHPQVANGHPQEAMKAITPRAFTPRTIERRLNGKDRRVGLPDTRENPVERRRVPQPDRRTTRADRRAPAPESHKD